MCDDYGLKLEGIEEMMVLETTERAHWNRIIQSFDNWDIYYLCEYAESLEKHGDGKAILLYDEENPNFAYVMMQRDISESGLFLDKLPKETYFDWETPYGYGGILQKKNMSVKQLKQFLKEVENYAKQNHVVAQFERYHPLLKNYEDMEQICEVRHNRETIFIDTSSKEVIWSNMDTKNRNMIRKAQKNGIFIEITKEVRIPEFMNIYEQTMNRNHASSYYYFKKEYFEYLSEHMKDYVQMFYAWKGDKIIGVSMFFYNERYMHYHLSGVLEEYKSYASMNLLLYEAANWASERGISFLHLGGGVSRNDSLYGFKKQFNKHGMAEFCIGRMIFIPEVYQELVELRGLCQKGFDKNNPYMIQYRA